MARNLLPAESPADLRAQATIGEADIALAKQFVRGMTAAARYFIGTELQNPLAAKVAKKFWEATGVSE